VCGVATPEPSGADVHVSSPSVSVAQAKTGTGKTLAFLVPVIQRIIEAQPELERPSRKRATADDIRAIVISPTRELAEQIGEEARKLARNTGVRVQTAVGGTQKNAMLRKTRAEGCHLLIATPGRLNDLLSDPTSGIAAPRLAALVLDEADRMLEVGFKAELESIVSLLPDRNTVPRQTLLYSATLPKNVVNIARTYINPANFEFVQTVRPDDTPTHERVPQFIVPCRGFENLPATLLELVRRELKASYEDKTKMPLKTIVFLPTTASVVCYASMFRRIAYQDKDLPPIYDIHSKLSQFERSRNSDNFKRAQSAILFSSDVTARGMDFPNVSHVIQVHLPSNRDQYIHRIGRTGRAGKEGQAWLLVSDIEIPAARDMLPGLPIKRFTELSGAVVDVKKAEESELPKEFVDITNAAQKLPYEIISETYRSFLGGALGDTDRQDVVNEINSMAKHTFGLEEPPAISPRLLANLPRGIKGLRLADANEGRFRNSIGNRGGRFGGRNERDAAPRKPRDAWEAMEMAGAQEKRRPTRARATFWMDIMVVRIVKHWLAGVWKVVKPGRERESKYQEIQE